MKQYLIPTMLTVLCACVDGGSNSSGTGHNYIKPGNTVSIGERPSGSNTNTPDKPSDSTFLRIKSPDMNYSFEHEGKIYASSLYRLGYIDKKSGVLYLERWLEDGSYYSMSCTKSEGCEYKYNNGEAYWVADKCHGCPDNYIRIEQCNNADGCLIRFDEGDSMIEYCRTEGGCSFPSSGAKFPLNGFINGKFVGKYIDEAPTYREDYEIALGSQDLHVPLTFSDFGYWNINSTDTEYGDWVEHIAFYAGAPDKEVNINKLISSNPLTETQTYTRKAYVGISSGVSMSPEPTDKDTHNGFIASGDAKLTLRPFDASASTSLAMNFSDAGWYNVYMNGDGTGLRFDGDAANDSRFSISEEPETVNDIDIHYYGNNPAAIPTEVVGTAFIQQVTMEDGLSRDISFSFGAVKD